MQNLSDEASSFNNSSFPNHAAMSYLPSKEILSIAQASQDFINEDTWGGNIYAPADDDFSFLPPPSNSIHDSSSFKFMDKLSEDCCFRPIEIGGMDEEFKYERIVENLRWVGMSEKDLKKVKPATRIYNLNEAEKNNDNSLDQFGNDNGIDSFLTDGNVDDFSSTSNFEVYEKIEVSHGMLVSTSQTANTFYHA
ncbi:hypothetical protein ACH5RR_013462 [Cinchona calisaya]|uniref:Uncharacterized protein n=1 Tax=Cinchona calisaya TaxID=153742 RepID=A0ABD3A3H3_9GENT